MSGCVSIEGPYHWQIFCGAYELRPQFKRHRCDYVLCPLKNRIVPSDVELSIDKIAKLHDYIAKQAPPDADVLETITKGLATTANEGAREPEWPPKPAEMKH